MRIDHTIRRDLGWVVRRAARRLLTGMLPLAAHWRIAVVKGKFRGKLVEVRAGVMDDLATAFPGKSSSEIDEIAAKNAEFRFRLKPLKDILPLICERGHRHRWELKGRENLDNAIRSGKGVMVLTAHLGYSKLITPILRSHGYDAVSVVAKSLRSMEREERVSRWLSRGGTARGALLKWLLSDSYERGCIAAQLDVRPIFAAFAANRLVLLAGDGLKAADFVPLRLLGRSYPFAKGFMRIAMMNQVPVLPTFAIEGEGGHYVTIHIGEPLAVDSHATVEENLRRFAEVMERQLLRTPHLWYRWGSWGDVEEMSQTKDEVVADIWNRGMKSILKTKRSSSSP